MFDFIKKHKLSTLFIILFFISTAMYSKNLKTKRNLNKVQRLILDVTLPIQELTQSITSSIHATVDNYLFLIDVKKENIILKKNMESLHARIKELNELEITNKRLRKLLEFKKTVKGKVIPAEVVSKGASTWLDTIIIDKGRNHGVIPGLAIVTEKGIIGHTIYTTNNYAQVLLITDKNSAVDIINQRSRSKGIVKGSKDNLCKIDYVLSEEDVIVDDVIITSGMDGIFPKGLLVGKVVGVTKSRYGLFQIASLEPFVNFDKIEEVLIILKQEALLKEIREIKEKR
jgi:rod shape-determining protein MreC